MKNFVIIFLAGLAIVFLANWGTPETSFGEQRKSTLNFYGTLETWQGQTYTVENITVDHRTQKIEMYEKPNNMPDSSKPAGQNGVSLSLTANPITNFTKVSVDLAEIESLEIKDPEIVWTYKRKKGHQDLTFFEIVATNNDPEKTRSTYLIESRKKLYCDRHIGESFEEREVPFTAVKKLTIEGFRHREEQQRSTKKAVANDTFKATKNIPSTIPIA